MKAIRVVELAGPDSLQLLDIDQPTPGPGEVLIEVHNAGVTYPEVLQTRGEYQVRHELPFTLGSEAAGTVVAAEPDSRFSPGDRVAVITGKDAFGEYLVADATHVVPLPAAVDFAAGACLPMNLLTADFALRVRARVQPGDSVLVHGAAGGLGATTVQLALAMGAEVVAVVSTPEKAQLVQDLGATHVVLADGFKDRVKELYPRGVDVVVDPVGGDRFTDSLRCLATFGQVLVLGFTAGTIPEVKVNRLLLNNISVVGVGWGAALSTDRDFIAKQWAELTPYLEAGVLNPHICQHYPLAEASSAIKELDDRAVLGKVVLDVKEAQ